MQRPPSNPRSQPQPTTHKESDTISSEHLVQTFDVFLDKAEFHRRTRRRYCVQGPSCLTLVPTTFATHSFM